MSDIAQLSQLAAVLLAISLATERLVAIIKTLRPEWFEAEKKTDAKEIDLPRDRWRRLSVQAVAFLAGWVTAAFLVKDQSWFVRFFTGIVPGTGLPSALVGLLASGGSAFWAQVVGYTSAVKDIARTKRASERLALTEQAKSMGREATGTGRVARSPQRDNLLDRPSGNHPSTGRTTMFIIELDEHAGDPDFWHASATRQTEPEIRAVTQTDGSTSAIPKQGRTAIEKDRTTLRNTVTGRNSDGTIWEILG